MYRRTLLHISIHLDCSLDIAAGSSAAQCSNAHQRQCRAVVSFSTVGQVNTRPTLDVSIARQTHTASMGRYHHRRAQQVSNSHILLSHRPWLGWAGCKSRGQALLLPLSLLVYTHTYACSCIVLTTNLLLPALLSSFVPDRPWLLDWSEQMLQLHAQCNLVSIT